MPDTTPVLIAGSRSLAPLRRAFEHAGHRVQVVPVAAAVDLVNEETEAVVMAASRATVLSASRRLKARFQMPLLPIVALVSRPARLPEAGGPDAWLSAATRPVDVVERVDDLVRIRHAERELVRLNATLAELAAENGRLYDRARRDAEATALLLRELQHRVRNNLAAIHALLVLERHRVPPRPLPDALDVAIGRLRSMAALQDLLLPHASTVDLATLAQAVAQSAIDVFGAAGEVRYDVVGRGSLPARSASAVAIVLNELITNALKHARANTVRIEIRGGGESGGTNGALELEVADNGCGMSPNSPGGSGLMIVRAVVRNELAGTMAIAVDGAGTRVRIRMPRGMERGAE